MIELNKNPTGKISNMIFGAFAIADGLIRVFSLGFLHSRFALNYSQYSTKKHFQKMKVKNEKI